jgi:hypothetical protein
MWDDSDVARPAMKNRFSVRLGASLSMGVLGQAYNLRAKDSKDIIL